jgi:hypothetical protein
LSATSAAGKPNYELLSAVDPHASVFAFAGGFALFILVSGYLGRNEPALAALALFLSHAYNLKAVADYELGPGARVPLERARDAIDRAVELIEQVAGLLEG